MKISKHLMLSIVGAMGVSTAHATVQEQTVYVNLSQLVSECQNGKEANTFLEKLRAEKAESINKKVKVFEASKAEYQKATAEYEAKKGLLKDLKSEEKKLTDIARKVAKLEAELKESAEDAEKDFRAEYMRLSEQLFKEEVEIIGDWAKEKKVAAVVDSESGRILYRQDTMDVTKEMLGYVNKKHEQKLAAKAATPAATKVATAPAKVATAPAKAA
jgi:Skp family chaperone for outer membrane proteins